MNRLDIKNVPFQELNDIFNDVLALNQWITSNKIAAKSNWIYPQIYSFLANFKLNDLGSGNTINGKQLWKQNLDISDPWQTGLVRFLLISPRGLTVRSQSNTGLPYCGLVPLVLAAFKQNKGVEYSRWDRDTLTAVVDPLLAEAMLWTSEKDTVYTNEELINIRTEGLIIRSGAKEGAVRNPATTYKLTGLTEYPEFSTIPSLAQVMITQIWCAHPLNRTNMMVLDPQSWDTMPTALIGHENLFVKEEVHPEFTPWD